jgi:hypothetical protein
MAKRRMAVHDAMRWVVDGRASATSRSASRVTHAITSLGITLSALLALSVPDATHRLLVGNGAVPILCFLVSATVVLVTYRRVARSHALIMMHIVGALAAISFAAVLFMWLTLIADANTYRQSLSAVFNAFAMTAVTAVAGVGITFYISLPLAVAAALTLRKAARLDDQRRDRSPARGA